MSALIKKILLSLLLSVVTLPAIAKNTILVVGDSLSAAYGMQQEQGWTQLLQQRLHDNHYDYQLVNASISGDTTSNGLVRLPQVLKKYQPALVLIELGGNDGLRGLPLSVIKQNLDKMISLAKQSGGQVVLIGVRLPPNYGPAYTQGFQQIYLDLTAENHVFLIPDLLQKVEQNQDYFQSDGIHPKAAAQPLLLETVWGSIQDKLSK